MVPRPSRPAIRLPVQRIAQCAKHAIHISHYVLIRESDRPVTEPRLYVGIAQAIGLRIMCMTIDLNQQALRWAKEIGDTEAHVGLTAKLVTVEPACPQSIPKPDFRFGRVFAHCRGPDKHGLASQPTTPNPLL